MSPGCVFDIETIVWCFCSSEAGSSSTASALRPRLSMGRPAAKSPAKTLASSATTPPALLAAVAAAAAGTGAKPATSNPYEAFSFARASGDGGGSSGSPLTDFARASGSSAGNPYDQFARSSGESGGLPSAGGGISGSPYVGLGTPAAAGPAGSGGGKAVSRANPYAFLLPPHADAAAAAPQLQQPLGSDSNALRAKSTPHAYGVPARTQARSPAANGGRSAAATGGAADSLRAASAASPYAMFTQLPASTGVPASGEVDSDSTATTSARGADIYAMFSRPSGDEASGGVAAPDDTAEREASLPTEAGGSIPGAGRGDQRRKNLPSAPGKGSPQLLFISQGGEVPRRARMCPASVTLTSMRLECQLHDVLYAYFRPCVNIRLAAGQDMPLAKAASGRAACGDARNCCARQSCR